ncbi:hypothetical protein BRE01_51710 [Brevibacillus reuszeri]|uniref:HD-GYP domain-containing protein n=1 Tax=Brevibacillus reuszeri TaxID=54915 RepID=A0A0K9YJW7_9BACL|nr:HD domain-containing phosphohydrolase [Brevibacillus reuszeri]KNB68956.1 hypothetical protein ADS79_31025 [Brevibacillus reuszeri]MED1859414.1 HD domain-containing phosphohydrolase [Brevibacillus reuszeri]GED71469.1 hypothetical protein BRE01_51710 [Brevibacillus reuszeri]
MKLRRKNRNHAEYLADSMFYWVSILVSIDALFAVALHALGLVMSNWTVRAGLIVCAAVAWTVYALHKRYVMTETSSYHVSSFLGVSLILFLCLYNPHQIANAWFVFLLYPIFLSFFHDKVLLWVWGTVSYILYVLSLGTGYSQAFSLATVFYLILAAASAICAWLGYGTVNKIMHDTKRSQEAYNREYAITLLNTLVPIVERKTQTSSREIDQMSRLMKRILREFPNEEVTDWEIKLLSLLHYVSRIKWPDYVFETHEKLTAFEFQIIQEHCHFGREMFGDDPAFARVIQALENHHERFDGTGYPHKRKGEEVSLLPQILGLVECYLAMTTARSYREIVTLEEAFDEICAMAGTSYDEKVVRAFAVAVQIQSPTLVSKAPSMVG